LSWDNSGGSATFLFQMANVPGTTLDGAGHAHTNGLHWEGFPRFLWESL